MTVCFKANCYCSIQSRSAVHCRLHLLKYTLWGLYENEIIWQCVSEDVPLSSNDTWLCYYPGRSSPQNVYYDTWKKKINICFTDCLGEKVLYVNYLTVKKEKCGSITCTGKERQIWNRTHSVSIYLLQREPNGIV